MHTYKKRLRFIAVFLALNILVESVAPYTAFALTSGPTQPEFTSFEPVATTNMVDPFTGGFTYNLPVINIPGPNGGGYGVSLSYHSGSTMEDEASWVGYGWTLNPGAINRNKSGFPDDINGGQIKYKNELPKIYSVSTGTRVGLEIFGGEGLRSTSISASQSRTFNSNKGFGRTTSFGVSPFGGIVSVSYTVTDGSSSFGASVNPGAILSLANQKSTKASAKTKKDNEPSSALKKKDPNRDVGQSAGVTGMSDYANYGLQSLQEVVRPTTIAEYTSFSIAIDLSVGASPAPIPVGIEGGVYGSYVWQTSKKTDKKAYGSMYISDPLNPANNYNNYKDGDKQLDYFVEKESYYNKRDLMLGIPYHGTDVYAVTGEGIGGGFKYKHNDVGNYVPTPLKNHTILTNGSVEATFGLHFKVGLGLGVGLHVLRSNLPEGQGNFDQYTFKAVPTNQDREKGFFRFSGDLSNSVSYSNNYDDGYVSASVGMTTFSKNTKIDANRILKEQETINGETQRAYRSSYVGYTTFLDFNTPETVNSKYLRSYTRDVYTRDLVAKSIPIAHRNTYGDAVVNGQIAEMYTVSADGNTYVYGLPVFSYQEKNVALGLDVVAGNHVSMDDENILSSSLNADKKLLADFNIEELHDYPYVANHLLTQIITPDYIDRTFDGPTADDFGGWTKFNYAPGQPYAANSTSENDYTGTGNWYSWRTPYKGYEYNRGSLSMVNDDMLQYNEGLKQQYFLESIETKTHIAYFVTNTTDKTITNENGQPIRIRGSLTARIDGASTAIGTGQAPASQTNRKLERVILFAKSDLSTAASTVVNGKPLKIANLEYYGYPANASTLQASSQMANALCHNIPNRLINTIDNPFGQNGKLTLKRIWFEYEGVVNAKISPYEFYYEYKNNWSLPATLQTKYSAVTGYGSNYTSSDQNPTYNPLNKDAWGNYTDEGLARAKILNNTVSQKPSATFDPAAWQLKRIVLPSGGELLVQYEQADYKYVHDENATVLTKLIDPVNAGTTTKTDGGTNADKYYIDLASIGITTPTDITAAETEIRKYLAGHKLYFKFLYSLNGNTASIKDCNVEYITGYAKAEVTQDVPAGKLFITFPAADPQVTKDNYTVPKKVCQDFFLKERKGLELMANCNNVKRIPIAAAIQNNRAGALPALMQVVAAPNEPYPDYCQTLSLQDSYVRIPVLYGKKGGGIRVKRVMMFDPGLETGDQMLYGSEYIYKLADNKTSSGVATNEPAAIREENVLIDFLQKRAPQKWIQKITSGLDKDQFEGPVGEALLPAPSIGYSRVVVKNIHTGKTNTGFTVQEFYTAFDHPISVWGGDKSSVNVGTDKKRYFPGIFASVKIDKGYASQGYAFVLYDIHGKPKRVATFQGDYDITSTVNESTSYMSYQELYDYTKPGERVNVLDYNGEIRSIPMGRDEEIAMEMRSVSDITDDFSIKFDGGVGYAVLPIPSLTIWPSLGDDEKELNTHVTNKVIRYSPILKSTTVSKDGVIHVTENKVFSISNGTPLVTVTYDGYDALKLEQDPTNNHKGAYVNYSVPADYIYKDLSGKFKNEKLTYGLSGTITNVDPANGKYKISIGQAEFNKGYCATGDLLKISGSSDAYCYVVDLVKQGVTYDMVIQMLPGTTLAGSMISSAQNFTCFVIHSGFSNQLNSSVASVTTYGDDPSSISSPVIFGGGQRKLRAFPNAVNASVQTFKGTRAYNSSVDPAYNLTAGYNEFLAGRAGKWRPFESYTQKKAIVPASTTATSRIYNAGTFSSDVFDYDPIATNTLWTKTNTVTLYSPDGNPLEEKNILNIYSTAKFGYGGNVPMVVAKNSQFNTSYFNGFEDFPASQTNIVKNIAHTGTQSLSVPSSGYVFSDYQNAQVKNFSLGITDQLVNKGILIRMWVKMDDVSYAKGIGANIYIAGNYGGGNIYFAMSEIARVGEWSLIEGIIPKDKVSVAAGGGTTTIYNIGGGTVYVDDIRLQPYDAEMACYVYDPKNLRLLASFDDQHFAMMYQYNAEGKLLRKLVETEKGVKTITESQFNTPQKTY